MGMGQFYSSQGMDAPIPGEGRVASNATNAAVRVDQRLEEKIPLGLEFNKEDGSRVKIGSLLNGRPTILLLIFYECTGICTQELNSLVETLNGFRRDEDEIGQLADVIAVSINPTEDTDMARLKKESYVSLYDREGTEDSWHFLTGELDNINALADSIGYKFTYDAANNQIVHPAALVVLTPEGKISKYFLRTQYDQKPLLEALKAAGNNEIGERSEVESFLSCIKLDAFGSARSRMIWNTTVLLALATMLGVGAWIFSMNRSERLELEQEEADGS